MRTSSRVLISALALLLVAAFAILPGTAKANMNKPTWTAGDYWVYAVSSGGASIPNTSLRLDVTGTESLTVNGTAYPTYHVAATVSVQFIGTTTYPADIWFSTDTLAIVKLKVVLTVKIGNISAGGTFEIAGNPPQTIQWPLTAGATWPSSTVVWTTTTNTSGAKSYSNATLSTDFSVQSDASVTVPRGTFTTTPLKETSANGSYTMNFWSADVGNWARVGYYDRSNRNTENFNLTAYNYQGGSFFTSIVLGLPVWIWLVLLIVILVAIVGFFAVRRRRPPAAMPQAMPPEMPPQQPPMGP